MDRFNIVVETSTPSGNWNRRGYYSTFHIAVRAAVRVVAQDKSGVSVTPLEDFLDNFGELTKELDRILEKIPAPYDAPAATWGSDEPISE